MRKLKEIWLGLDIINRIILISGILACICQGTRTVRRGAGGADGYADGQPEE